MSRFFTGGSSSSSESESGSEEEQIIVKQTTASKAPAKVKANFDSDDDDESGKRTVRSEKQKRFDELQNSIAKMTLAMKTHEWGTINTEFDVLQKSYQKAAPVIQKEGIPPFFTLFLIKLEDAIKNTVDNKNSIKMSPTNAKAFNAMRQKAKKYNAAFEPQIKDQRAKQPAKKVETKPESEGEGSSEEESSDEEAPVKQAKVTAAPKKVAKATAKPVKPSKGESDSDEEGGDEDSDWGNDSDSDSDSGSDVDVDGQSLTAEEKRARWFLPAKKDDKKSDKKDEKKPDAKPTPNQTKPEDPAKPADGAKEAPKEEKKEMPEAEVRAKLKEVLKGRGKKTTNQSKQMEKLNELLPHTTKNPQLQTEILAAICGVQFDMTPSGSQATQMSNWWKASIAMLSQLMTILETNTNIHVTEGEQKQQQTSTEEGEESYVSSLVGFVERLDDEFTRMLLALEIPTQDYLQRLNDEPLLLSIAERIQHYYEKEDKKPLAAKIAARRIKHMYFRYEGEKKSDSNSNSDAKKPAETKAMLDKLAHLVYLHGDERLKAHTVLCQIYHLSLHDFYNDARDLLLMSHLQENISHMDIATQILYNRTTVQVGLCAFRAGSLKVAHGCLADLFAGGRIKELLAQGFSSRYGDKTQQQEQIEKKRQYPYHMHINTDLIEAVHLMAAMLVEVPNMAANPYDPKKVISKSFRKMLHFHERQVFNGLPENNKECILAASKALMKGDWKDCSTILMALNIWNFMSNAETVKTMLQKKIQEEALRTYLFTYNHVYDSMKLKDLCSMFGLTEGELRPLVTKMIYSEELRGSWDQPTDTLILHRVEPTKLQFLALQLADKAAQFVENNEKILDTRTGSYGYKYDKTTTQAERREKNSNSRPLRGPTVVDNRTKKNIPKRNTRREDN